MNHCWQGELPRIGIRPTIDGRYGGVRESLEDQTQAMAAMVAEFLSEQVFYPTGEPVECIVADRCIGGVAEAAAAERLFQQRNVGLSLTVTPCWCYGSETMDTDPHRPKAVWGFNGTERPGAVYLAAVLAGHAQRGLPAFGIYGRDVQEADDTAIPDDVAEKLLRFARAGLAVALMRGRSYLSVGGVSMGIAGSVVDWSFFQNYLDMRVEAIDMTELARRIDGGIYDAGEYDEALQWVQQHCQTGFDANEERHRRSPAQLQSEWETSVQMALITRDLMTGNARLAEQGYPEEAQGKNAIAAGFQGQRQWTDAHPNGDFMEAILNSSFDWHGRRPPAILATENDALNAVTMLFGHLLTGTAQIFADLRTYWSPAAVQRVSGHRLQGDAAGGILHLLNSGPAALDGTGCQEVDGRPAIKPWWEVTEPEVSACLQATTWHPSMTEYFPGGGWSTRYVTRGGMPATIARVNLVAGLGPALQIAEGVTVDLPPEVHDQLDQRTNPTWPTTWFAPYITGIGAFADVYSVMNNWGANHCVMSGGHIGADLISLAALLRIPVYMHNIEDGRLFRPSSWNLFGTQAREAADFRACETLGPLYG